MKLLYNRELETMKDFWWSFNPDIKCQTPDSEEEDHSHGLGLESIGGVFIVIFVGIGIATVILAMEYPIFMLWRIITRSQVKTGSGKIVKPM